MPAGAGAGAVAARSRRRRRRRSERERWARLGRRPTHHRGHDSRRRGEKQGRGRCCHGDNRRRRPLRPRRGRRLERPGDLEPPRRRRGVVVAASRARRTIVRPIVSVPPSACQGPSAGAPHGPKTTDIPTKQVGAALTQHRPGRRGQRPQRGPAQLRVNDESHRHTRHTDLAHVAQCWLQGPPHTRLRRRPRRRRRRRVEGRRRRPRARRRQRTHRTVPQEPRVRPSQRHALQRTMCQRACLHSRPGRRRRGRRGRDGSSTRRSSPRRSRRTAPPPSRHRTRSAHCTQASRGRNEMS
jgi:hypothetical protein